MPCFLFVCVENSCRSQIAEAFARMAGVEAHSCGSEPSGRVNPKAIATMRELGYDLGTHSSKSSGDVPAIDYDAVISLCGDRCPAIPAMRRLNWSVPDPKDMSPDEFRAIRDDIAERVRNLVAGHSA